MSIVYEAKLRGEQVQYRALDEAIRTARFVRNSCLRYWMDTPGKNKYDLNKYTKVLADNPDFPWVRKLNSMARQAHAEAQSKALPVVEDDDLRVRAALGCDFSLL